MKFSLLIPLSITFFGTFFGLSSYAQMQPVDPAQDEAILWCNQVTTHLRSILQQAQWQQSNGNYTRAAALLSQGLEGASTTVPSAHGPLTNQALHHGVQLAAVIRHATANQPNAVRSNVLFLSEYYHFIFEVAEELDIPYYIPYRHCHLCSGQDDFQQFEQNFIRFVQREIQMVLQNLAIETETGVVPVGSLNAFLDVLSASARFAAQDLRQSPFLPRYACAVQNLESLVAFIQDSQPDAAIYRMNITYQRATEIVDQLNSFSCGGSGRNEYPRRRHQ